MKPEDFCIGSFRQLLRFRLSEALDLAGEDFEVVFVPGQFRLGADILDIHHRAVDLGEATNEPVLRLLTIMPRSASADSALLTVMREH